MSGHYMVCPACKKDSGVRENYNEADEWPCVTCGAELLLVYGYEDLPRDGVTVHSTVLEKKALLKIAEKVERGGRKSSVEEEILKAVELGDSAAKKFEGGASATPLHWVVEVTRGGDRCFVKRSPKGKKTIFAYEVEDAEEFASEAEAREVALEFSGKATPVYMRVTFPKWVAKVTDSYLRLGGEKGRDRFFVPKQKDASRFLTREEALREGKPYEARAVKLRSTGRKEKALPPLRGGSGEESPTGKVERWGLKTPEGWLVEGERGLFTHTSDVRKASRYPTRTEAQRAVHRAARSVAIEAVTYERIRVRAREPKRRWAIRFPTLAAWAIVGGMGVATETTGDLADATKFSGEGMAREWATKEGGVAVEVTGKSGASMANTPSGKLGPGDGLRLGARVVHSWDEEEGRRHGIGHIVDMDAARDDGRSVEVRWAKHDGPPSSDDLVGFHKPEELQVVYYPDTGEIPVTKPARKITLLETSDGVPIDEVTEPEPRARVPRKVLAGLSLVFASFKANHFLLSENAKVAQAWIERECKRLHGEKEPSQEIGTRLIVPKVVLEGLRAMSQWHEENEKPRSRNVASAQHWIKGLTETVLIKCGSCGSERTLVELTKGLCKVCYRAGRTEKTAKGRRRRTKDRA